MYTGNLYIEKGKISCNGYNASFENITNAFDQNPETYAIFTLYDDKVSFINLLVDVTQNANTNNISKIHIKSEDSRNETTKIIATIPDSNNIDKTVSTIYDGNTFNLNKDVIIEKKEEGIILKKNGKTHILIILQPMNFTCNQITLSY